MANIIASGDWWTLYDTGLLDIYCVGDMPYSSNALSPWSNNYAEQVTSAEIRNSVTNIGDYAFYECSNMASATIPSSVTSIGISAFEDCTALESVTMPDNITSIGVHAFAECGLTSVTVPGGVTSIGDGAFRACTSLTSVAIQDGVTSIVGSMFYECTSLTSVTIPDSVTLIDEYAFCWCGSLTSVTIPSSVIRIGSAAFANCNALSDVYYSGTETQWNAVTIGNVNAPLRNATIHYNYSPPEPSRIQIQVEKHNGDMLTFSEHAVKSLEYVQSTSFDGNDMQSDEMSTVIRQTSPDWLSNWKGANGVNRACPVVLTLNSRNGTLLRTEKYCFKELRRVAKYDFQMTAQSPLGRLTDDFPGGLYSAAPLSTIIAAVIGDAIPANEYSINPKLEKVSMYGWIPYQERRTTLHQLALAYGFIIRRNASNNLYFTVPDTDNPYTIPANAIFTGGSVDYSVGRTYARADITAYDYSPIETEAKVLFDNTSGAPADKFIVRFDSPMFDLWTDTLRISGYGVNYAEVSGYGRLTGKPYTQIASVISVNGDADADPQNILSVSNIPMITSLNAVSVGERLLNYNNAPAVVNMDILRTNQRPGDYVSFTDPFGDPQTSGYITALSGSITSIDRASVSVVCGYVPVWGSSYDSVIVLTKETALEDDNTWTVPDYLNSKKIRIVLIGGGTGGASGQHGTDSGGKGGIGGIPGAGGKIYDTTLLVSGGNIFRYQCGTGGAGGVASDVTTNNLDDSTRVYESNGVYHLKAHGDGTFYATTLKAARDNGSTPCSECFKSGDRYYVNNNGSDGTASTFVNQASDVNLSSNGGSSSDIGFYDIIENKMYAAPGTYNGVDGGSATTGTERTQAEDKTRTQQHIGPEWLSVTLYPVSLPWYTSQEWFSGNPGTGDSHYEGGGDEYTYEWAYGGLGGGAAVGYNGNNGGSARGHYAGGNGGNGANADTIFHNIIYGGGGNGGHGGGEGGIGGKGYSVGDDPQEASDGASGSGGNGSNGQDGADGCILIYYKSPDA